MQKLISKSKFAQMAGVNPSTVTRLSETILKAAIVGKKVDAAHPDAVNYLKNRERDQTPPAATGLDPLYEEAVAACDAAGRYSISFVQKALRVGWERASKLVGVMKANGLVPDPDGDKVTLTSEEAPPVVMDKAVAERLGLIGGKPRGQAAVREAKKQSAPPEDFVFEVPDDIQAFADMTLRELVERFGTDVRFLDWLKATKAIEDINEKRLKNAQTKGELVNRQLVKVGIIEPIDSAHIKLLTDGSKTIARRATAMHDAGRDLEDIEKFVADQISSFIRQVKSKVARALKNA